MSSVNNEMDICKISYHRNGHFVSKRNYEVKNMDQLLGTNNVIEISHIYLFVSFKVIT